jgi:hypothetical protein
VYDPRFRVHANLRDSLVALYRGLDDPTAFFWRMDFPAQRESSTVSLLDFGADLLTNFHLMNARLVLMADELEIADVFERSVVPLDIHPGCLPRGLLLRVYPLDPETPVTLSALAVVLNKLRTDFATQALECGLAWREHESHLWSRRRRVCHDPPEAPLSRARVPEAR